LCRCDIVLTLSLNHVATSDIYTLSLHDALPIYDHERHGYQRDADPFREIESECARHVRGKGAGGRGRRGDAGRHDGEADDEGDEDRKSTRLNSSHVKSSYAVYCLNKKHALH